MQTVKTQLRAFKLSGMVQSLEERVAYATEKSLPYTDFLSLLLEDETNNRSDNSYKKRCAKAKLPTYKKIEDFDFAFQPSIDKRVINTALTCQFIRDKKNIVFIGNPGVGKTHLSIAIAIKALQKGHKVLFTTTAHMLHDLHTSKADNSYHKKLEFYLTPDLIIVDELGFKKVPNHSADDFFEVISRRYEQGSFDQWGDIFADNILASAILDRIIHYSEVIKINGPSFRQKDLKKTDK
ncbi:IS21-like element helper ATPase IstB [soil metagenome]